MCSAKGDTRKKFVAQGYTKLVTDLLKSYSSKDAALNLNFHIDLEGVLLECSDEQLDAQATKLVTCVLFKESVGKKHVPNNGSQSCLGWVACGGNTLKEAEENLQKALSQVSIRIE